VNSIVTKKVNQGGTINPKKPTFKNCVCSLRVCYILPWLGQVVADASRGRRLPNRTVGLIRLYRNKMDVREERDYPARGEEFAGQRRTAGGCQKQMRVRNIRMDRTESNAKPCLWRPDCPQQHNR